MFATIVGTSALLKAVAASFVAGIVVTLSFSLAVYGATRFADLRSDDRPVAALAAGTLAVLGMAVTAAAIVFGIVVMAAK